MKKSKGRRRRKNHRRFNFKNTCFRNSELLWKDKDTPLELCSVAEIFAAADALDRLIAVREEFFKKLDQLRS